MVITKEVLTHSGNKPMAHPHCSDCIKRRKTNELETITAFLQEKAPDQQESEGEETEE